jgi:DNA-binding transcriptional MerR regulator
MIDEDKLLFSIKEVAAEFNLTLPTLRFWETLFRQIKPVKNKRGVRFYTKESLETIRTITYLSRQQGYTLEGVKKYLDGKKSRNIDKNAQIVQTLEEIKYVLLNIKEGMELKQK